MLDDIPLPQVQEITTYERRALAEHKAPGMAGSLLQNLGRRPTCLLLWGVVTGADALQTIDQLDNKFKAGQPLPFSADITANANLEKVIIDNLQVQDLAGKPQRYSYVLTLREYIEPVAPEDLSALNNNILSDALGALDSLTAGLELVEQLSAFTRQLGEINQSLDREGLGAVLPSS